MNISREAIIYILEQKHNKSSDYRTRHIIEDIRNGKDFNCFLQNDFLGDWYVIETTKHTTVVGEDEFISLKNQYKRQLKLDRILKD